MSRAKGTGLQFVMDGRQLPGAFALRARPGGRLCGHLHSTIVVKDLESGEVDAVKYKPDLR